MTASEIDELHRRRAELLRRYQDAAGPAERARLGVELALIGHELERLADRARRQARHHWQRDGRKAALGRDA